MNVITAATTVLQLTLKAITLVEQGKALIAAKDQGEADRILADLRAQADALGPVLDAALEG